MDLTVTENLVPYNVRNACIYNRLGISIGPTVNLKKKQ
jgi:hypothetical protein